uniref:J domain-containing protein n=1 Tax=Panagrellus redivivus TaxID=6233 RepID=A0A7E4VQ97_PANRE
MGIFDDFYEKAKGLFGENQTSKKKKDYYELLEVDSQATDDVIKKSYRKLALKWHPDKNQGREEECAAYFTLLQQAYEVLSDPRERAFYDKHKDNILREEDASEEKRDEGLKLYEYFQPCFKGFGDDAQGFFTVYRGVFDHLSTEEFPYLEDPTEHEFPTFGRSDSDYDMVVGPFYDFWTNFSTARTFAWLDKWNLRDAPNRPTLRAMEKENKKLRDDGKRERNDEIRELATYIRKRDPRVKEYRKKLDERVKKEFERVEEHRKKMIRENLEKLEGTHVEDEEARLAHLKHLEEIEQELDAQFGTVKVEAGSDDEEGENGGFECVVCDKQFKNGKSYANHQKSKKHKQALEELRRHMKAEDALLLQGSQDEEAEVEDDTPRRRGKAKKKKKNRKEEAVLGDEEDVDELDTTVADESIESPAVEELVEEVEAIKIEHDFVSRAKEKKRRNKPEPKATPTQAPSGPKSSECQVCGLDFDSRSKLFKHIEATGHAILKSAAPPPPAAKTGKKKGKK